MKIAAKFEKVSKRQYQEDFLNTFPNSVEDVEKVYEGIKLPKRATRGSAGYDFFAPVEIKLNPGETIKIPTGIRCVMNEGWVLKLFPRSGLGFKYRLQIDNTVGIIDQDYAFSDNEGHIFIKITNDTKGDKVCTIPCGSGFAQGLFEEFGITEDDDVSEIRNGGFGSTSK